MSEEDIKKLLDKALDVMLLFDILKKALSFDSNIYTPLTDIINKKIVALYNDIEDYDTKLSF